MNYNAQNVEDYLAQLPEDRKAAMEKLLQTVREHIPPDSKKA